ncbi:MAG: tRNA 5-methoxyuridine(34)/uridine 5-oxyacetic acid(34) synthase CmoB [Ghiorsea sp.]|nr:tRNA 5-methoxyuridine(34)/uridine 5-oxyacetic acid(34) synthase CmoB [Ghiorsea sp.]
MGFTETYNRAEQERFAQALKSSGLLGETNDLLTLWRDGWQQCFAHGDYVRWSEAFESLPDMSQMKIQLDDKVSVQSSASNIDNVQVEKALKTLTPWRKGPFEVFGVYVDTEWRSDLKWQRILPHLSSLEGRKVLDIGCGSGYHLWRMYEQQAKLVLGIEPSPLFNFHFACIKRYQPQAPVFLLPTGIDEMPDAMSSFDTVFSMGILYHRKSPLEHLYKIKSLLRKGGEVVLETLVVDGDEQTCLMPEARYAKMRNVWFLPSVSMLTLWMQRVGFKNVRCVDVNTTTSQEQRSTDWMYFESLADFLDPNDNRKTIEGYAAPQRAVLIANT